MKNEVSDKQWEAHYAYRRMCYVEMKKTIGSTPIFLVHHSRYMSKENKRPSPLRANPTHVRLRRPWYHRLD